MASTQSYRSLRTYKELTPPVAFDVTDVQSYVPFQDPAADDPTTAELVKCQGIGISVSSGEVEFSYDGTVVHGKVSQADGYVFFLGIRETQIYFQAAAAATVKVWAW